VPVIAALELDDAIAPRVPAREPDRAHRGLGPGRHEPDHVDRRDGVDELRRELDFALGGRAVARPVRGSGLDCRDRLGVRMAEDQRAPGHHPVDIAGAVDVLEERAFAAAHEEGIEVAHRPPRAHRRVDSSGDEA
jgi:hypothetical protein